MARKKTLSADEDQPQTPEPEKPTPVAKSEETKPAIQKCPKCGKVCDRTVRGLLWHYECPNKPCKFEMSGPPNLRLVKRRMLEKRDG